jgi:manganese/zinc/iron transport system substrate-binding protein
MHTAAPLGRLAAVVAAISAAFITACERSPAADTKARTPATASTAPLAIVATTGMVADIVRNVAGDRAVVTSLMGDGVDPHLYKPTRDDIAALLAADVVVASGLLLEGKMTDAFDRVRAAGKTVIVATDAIPKAALRTKPADDPSAHHSTGASTSDSNALPPDPHVWMDPTLWAAATLGVADALAKADPAHAGDYRARAKAYADQLAALDAYVKTSMTGVPETSRVLVTAHDAFYYFGARYNVRVLGIQGISTESEAGVRDVERLVDTLVSGKVPAVFVESTVSDRNIMALIAGAAARGHTVALGGSLYSDAMGPPDTYEGTYIGMIDHNATTIARALGGTVPERGMQGKLATPSK